MNKIKQLLLENKAWSEGKRMRDPDYFTNMAKDQNPDYLWIGCSDSRVDPSELTNTQPGEMFVHRNIANLVLHTDLNLQSVIQYAVEALKVSHIIVCGHYNCGGVRAATLQPSLGTIDHWISHIKDTYQFHHFEVNGLKEEDRVNRLVELNTLNQIKNLAHSPVIQKAWTTRPGYPILHGWVYDINSGLIKTLTAVNSVADVENIRRYSFK